MGTIWTESGAWPDLISAMRLALTGKQASDKADRKVSRWAELPGLCCQAAGGEAAWADDLTLAWLLFYAAADLMDSVQDQDEPDEWWREQGPGAALAAASGLYFSGSSILAQLYRNVETSQAAPCLILDFYQTLLTMTSGQYRDLTAETTSLAEYWRLAESKSGAFFRLASMSGARLANPNQTIMRAYADYGLHLGLLIQVMDDLDDIRRLRGLLPAGFQSKIKSSLPFIYAIEVNPPATRERLLACLASAEANESAAAELVALLDECEAATYVLAEMEHQRSSALASLEQAQPAQPYKEILVSLVKDL